MVGLDNTFIGGSNGFKRSEHCRKYRITVIYAGTNFWEFF